MVVGLVTTALTPVQHALAADEPDLLVGIDDITPTLAEPGKTLTMTGTVTNRDDHVWKNVQAYLVIPKTPFTTRAQFDEVVGSGETYTGRRIVELDTIDILGDLDPDQSTSFRLRVPYEQLGLTGAEGVYPVGVQLLGTDVDGTRGTDAIGRATTFLPLVDDVGGGEVSTGLVWPFVSPVTRGGDGDYEDVEAFVRTIGPDGRLRHLLDLAATMPAGATTVMIDPALLQAADDVAEGRRLREQATPDQTAAAASFRDDLLTLARSTSTWVVDHDRPDLLAISRSGDDERLLQAVDSTTDIEAEALSLAGRRVSWLAGGVDRDVLELVRRGANRPAVVGSGSLPGWDRRDGSFVRIPTEGGDLPVLVADKLAAKVPGVRSVATVRQGLLAEAALAVLQQGIDDGSRADALVVVPSSWDPGPSWSAANLPGVFDLDWVAARTPNSQLDGELPVYEGEVDGVGDGEGLDATQIAAVTHLLSRAAVLGDVLADRESFDAATDRDVADLLSVRWRGERERSTTIARERAAADDSVLDAIALEGPDRVTLSSSQGRFPLTISNGSNSPVRVGVRLDSSNPALSLPAVDAVDVAAGERLTITVEVDVGSQSSATVTARLVTPAGETFAMPTVFNVRSSAVGTVLWVAMGLAALFVAITLVRRFRVRRHVSSVPLPEADDD